MGGCPESYIARDLRSRAFSQVTTTFICSESHVIVMAKPPELICSHNDCSAAGYMESMNLSKWGSSSFVGPLLLDQRKISSRRSLRFYLQNKMDNQGPDPLTTQHR